MCGILGFMTENASEKNVKYFRKILRLSMSRGSDATGIFYDNGGSIVIAKEPISADKFIHDVMPLHNENISRSHVAFGHTRTPTVGTPKDNNNNHPVDSDDWVLVHNGTVINMDRIKDYPYKGEVDSEILVSYIQRHGLKDGLPFVGRGTAAIAVVNKSDLNSIYLWREASPIKIAYDDTTKTIFFASEEDFLAKGLANRLLLFTTFQIRELPSNLLIKITANPINIEAIGYVNVHKSSYSSSYYYGDYHSDLAGYCGGLGSNRKSAGDKSDKNDNKKLDAVGLVWSAKSYRWEAPKQIESKTEGSAVSDKLDKIASESVKKILSDLGYTREEIDRMNDGAVATLLYRGTPATDMEVLSNGSIKSRDCESSKTDSATLSNRYYFKDKLSKDFKGGWIKLSEPNRGYISIDAKFLKKWDSDKKQHFIISWEDAVKENLIDIKNAQEDYDNLYGLKIDPEIFDEEVPHESHNVKNVILHRVS